jgi:hypothetical protein
MSSPESLAVIVAAGLGGLALWLAPLIVAAARRAENIWIVAVLTGLTPVTGVSWLIAWPVVFALPARPRSPSAARARQAAALQSPGQWYPQAPGITVYPPAAPRPHQDSPHAVRFSGTQGAPPPAGPGRGTPPYPSAQIADLAGRRPLPAGLRAASRNASRNGPRYRRPAALSAVTEAAQAPA